MAGIRGKHNKENPARNQVKIRMTDEELNILNECSEKLDISKSDVVRKGVKIVHNSLTENK